MTYAIYEKILWPHIMPKLNKREFSKLLLKAGAKDSRLKYIDNLTDAELSMFRRDVRPVPEIIIEDYYGDDAPTRVQAYFKDRFTNRIASTNDLVEKMTNMISQDNSMSWKQKTELLACAKQESIDVFLANLLIYTIISISTQKEAIQNNSLAIPQNSDASQKEIFLKKWDGYLFLHQPHNGGNSIKLKDIYLVPECKKGSKIRNTVEEIERFVLGNTFRSMIIIGNPGVGKSSLISFLADNYQRSPNFIFIRMAELEPQMAMSSLLDAVVDFLECKKRDLKNKVLILDGYDELRVDNLHYRLCVSLIAEILSIEGLKVVISSRKNYIDLNKDTYQLDFNKTITLELLPFDKEKIKLYVSKFNELIVTKNKYKLREIDSTKTPVEVFGIPFILYLICSFDMDISNINNIIDVYNRVFAFNGGLFDKIYDTNGHYLLNNPQVKKELLTISKEIAFKMYQLNQVELSQDVMIEILQHYPERKMDFAIGNYYSIENGSVLFIHRTFFEYFFCLHLVDVLSLKINNRDDPSEMFKTYRELFYCDNYLYKRLEVMLKIIMSEKHDWLNDDVMKNSVELVLSSLLYFDNNQNAILEYKRIQNLVSSTLKTYKLILGDNWMFYLSEKSINSLLLILRLKNYVRIEMNGAVIRNADMSALFLRAPILGCQFSSCNLCRVDFRGTPITSSGFIDCSLRSIFAYKAIISHCTFTNVVFNHSNMEECTFMNCEFKNVDFSNVNLTDSAFIDCKMSGKINGACLCNATFKRTIMNMKGEIPNEFLSGTTFDSKSIGFLREDHNISYSLNETLIDLAPYPTDYYFVAPNHNTIIDLETYRRSFFTYIKLKQLLNKHKLVPVELFLFAETLISAPEYIFDGMNGELMALTYNEGYQNEEYHVSIRISVKNNIDNNMQLIERVNTNKKSSIKSKWESLSSSDKEVEIVICSRKNQRINCLKVLMDDADIE